jgi:type II secretory ATPase GspE/PulE/Tfp pilus assembly ATPase PilB-like protein
VRASTYPTIHGEKVVLRLLDKERQSFTLESIGMSDAVYAQWLQILERREGIVLVTGPTGSGKSSTLFATLRYLNRPDINIVTLEDPVEYELVGVSQGQVNDRAGFTFARGLRSILRQDPDVILVGEIRDLETAEIAVQAALTGHLVLATLHTNDAPSSVNRLVNMGVPRFLLASSLLGVLAQRLVRKLCQDCWTSAEPTEEERLRLWPWLEGDLPFLDGTGCDRCLGIGYRGRTGAHELLTVDRAVQELVLAEASTGSLASAGLRSGYQAMWKDGLTKVAAGITSLRELARSITPSEDGSSTVAGSRTEDLTDQPGKEDD